MTTDCAACALVFQWQGVGLLRLCFSGTNTVATPLFLAIVEIKNTWFEYGV